VFVEHAALSGFENTPTQRLRDFDISGLRHLSQADYDALQPVQWPINETHPQGTPRLFTDQRYFTASGRANFIAITSKLPGNPLSHTYPLALNTGRIRDQWHTMTRTGLAPQLNQHKSEPFVEIHPADAARFGIRDQSLVVVESEHGQMIGRANITRDQLAGTVFAPIHWTAQLSSKGRVGAVVNAVVDPVSGQPETKHTPVRIFPFAGRWYGFLLSRR